VRRLSRILFHAATTISLLLCVATRVFWVRSYRVYDGVLWVTAGKSASGYAYYSGLGVFTLRRITLSRAVEVDEAGWAISRTNPSLFEDARGRMHENSWHGFAWRTHRFLNQPQNLGVRWDDISLPYGFLLACTAALPVVLVYRKLRGIRTRAGVCAKCGYDLCATPDRCPECGTVPVHAGAPTGERK
jgi:hypothetical protein